MTTTLLQPSVAHSPNGRPSTASAAVEVHGLTKQFHGKTVVDRVELRIPRGSAFGYLGPNGAGKTTLIRMLLGLTQPTAGQISLLGRPIPAARAEALARVGAIVEEPRFHGYLTGRENLAILAAAREPSAEARIPAALERVRLTARADDRVATYSQGMRQRLGIAGCLLADPEMLILDEPTNGLDPAGIIEMRELVRSLVEEGRTVVISSHLLAEVEKMCDAVAIVDHGRVVAQGPITDIAAGHATLIAACSDPIAARSVVSALPLVTTVADVANGTLRIGLASDTNERAGAAAVSRAVIGAGLDLYRLEPEVISLEQRFLEITGREEVA